MADFAGLAKLTGLQGIMATLTNTGKRWDKDQVQKRHSAMRRALALVDPILVKSISKRTKTRSGQLRRLRSLVKKGPVGIIGPTAIYAAAQEAGGRIKAKKGNLAIPLPAALTASGVSRGGPRSIPDLFVITGKSGKKVLVQDVGGRLKAFFVLQKSVRLKAKKFMLPAAKEAAPKVAALLGKDFVLGIKKGKRRR